MSLFVTGMSSIALLLLILYKFILYPAFVSPLSNIPNAHWTSSTFPIWIWWKRRIGFESRAIYSTHQKRGPIIRLAPNELSLASLDGLRQVYTAGFEKDPWYLDEFVNYGIPNLVSMLQHQPHSIQKRMISHVYSKSYLQSSHDLAVISTVIVHERFLPLLSLAAQRNAPVEVFKLSQAVGMDFTSAYLFGITNSTNFINDVSARQHYSKLWRAKLRHSPGAEKASKEIESIIMSMCEAAETFMQNPTPEKESPTVTTSIQSTPTTTPVVYSQLSSHIAVSQAHHTTSKPEIFIVASEMLDHLVAGFGTSGVALTYLLYQMSLHPATQDALRKELHCVKLALSHPRHPENAHLDPPLPGALDTLPLLNAIIYETLRLHAPSPSPLPRVTPAGGITLGGYPNIPAGVRVSTSSYSMHRDEHAYPDPEAWKPERWLHGDREKGMGGSQEMRQWFWAFGSGGRVCVGRNFALYRT